MLTTMRPWTERDMEYVCDHYGIDLTVARIAADLGRTRASVSSWLRKSGIPMRRTPLSPADLRYVRRHYRQLPTKQLAADLGRPVRSVWNAAVKLGLARKVERMTPARAEVLRRMVGEGACNRCIGRAINLGRKEVRRWRQRLGLPPVASRSMLATCSSCIEKVRANTRRQLDRAGLSSLAEVRVQAFRDYARRHGWPEDLRPRAVQILNVLAREGPKTKIELAQAIGMRWRGQPSRKTLVSNDPEGSYLAHLMKRGLVVALGRAYRQGYRWEMVYSISPFAERQCNDA